MQHSYRQNGRTNSGSLNSNAKLTEEQVISMREQKNSHSKKELAEMYNISYQTVVRILRGELWKDGDAIYGQQ